jgi:hypothetical protein
VVTIQRTNCIGSELLKTTVDRQLQLLFIEFATNEFIINTLCRDDVIVHKKPRS